MPVNMNNALALSIDDLKNLTLGPPTLQDRNQLPHSKDCHSSWLGQARQLLREQQWHLTTVADLGQP